MAIVTYGDRQGEDWLGIWELGIKLIMNGNADIIMQVVQEAGKRQRSGNTTTRHTDRTV